MIRLFSRKLPDGGATKEAKIFGTSNAGLAKEGSTPEIQHSVPGSSVWKIRKIISDSSVRAKPNREGICPPDV